MDINSTEEQQLETLKQWWQEYGKSIILGAVIGLGGLFGWRYYQSHQIETRAAGADAFAQISEQLASKGPAAFDDAAAFVEQNRGNSYGELAALLLAAEAVKANKLDLAQQQLELALAGTEDAALSDTIRLRLARVLLAQNQLAEAQSTLDAITADAFAAQRSEVQGDILMAEGKADDARDAYRAARDAGGLNDNPGLQLKLDNLAVSAELGDEE
ncbi:tetratricopeptide repeat protein [Oceanisphaera sediminis]|uniref:Ancillary SecYEG translocon subunit n=1 Tax=Oceanisphaera sediminis TaxID=981381 RepID=A0ABP7D2V5_9GAMM